MKKTYSKTTGATILLQIDQAATNAAIQAALAKLEPLPKLTSPAVDADDEAKAKHQASLMAQMQVQGKRDAQVREQVGSVYYPNDEVRDDAPPAGFDPSTDTIDGFGHSWVVGKEARTAQRKAANDAAAVAVVKARRQALLAETDPIANRDNRQTAALTATQMTALAAKGKAITAAQRKELEAYAQALRDVPETVKTWPSIKDSEWPAKPAWLDAMVKRVQA